MKPTCRTLLLASLAAAALTASSPLVLAQSRSTAVLTDRTGDVPQSVVVTMVDGDVKVVVDGETIPNDRVVRRDGLYEIRITDDKVIRFRTDAEDGIQFVAPEPAAAPTRGRIGVTLADVGDVLADQLGLDPRSVFVITDVRKGLPAERAGLRQNDIVTHINGESPVTIAMLTRLVSGMTPPGDRVRFRVLRRGEPMDIEVEVEAAEPAVDLQREIEVLRRVQPDGGNVFQRQIELGQAQLEQLRGQLEPLRGQGRQIRVETEKLISELREGQEELITTLRQEVEKLGSELEEETLDTVRRAMLDAARMLENMDVNIRFGAGLGAPHVEFLPNGDRRGAVVLERAPAALAPPAAGLTPRQIEREIEERDRNREEQERLKRLEERMERLEALLERLVEKAG